MTSISIHIFANQSSYHDDKSTLQCFTHAFIPQLIRNVRSRRRIDSSSIIAHPVNSDLHTWSRSLTCYAKNSAYIHVYTYIYLYMYICRVYIYIYIYEWWCAWQSMWIFFTGSTWDWLHHFPQSLFMKIRRKNFFLNIFINWLAKWIIMLQFMDLRWPRVFRRSNVGLLWIHYIDVIWTSRRITDHHCFDTVMHP